MTVTLDPHEYETQAFFEIAGDITGKRVLEIGCGDGRLTWRYAHQAASVVGIDPDPEKIERALQNRSAQNAHKTTFHSSGLEQFRTSPDAAPSSFDLALLSWSL